jgi:hypothetical protein
MLGFLRVREYLNFRQKIYLVWVLLVSGIYILLVVEVEAVGVVAVYL